MEIKYLLMTDQNKAQEAALDVKIYTGLVKDFGMIDEEPYEIDSQYYVKYLEGMETSKFSEFIIDVVLERPDEATLNQAFNASTEKNEEGFALYRKIIADVGISGGLSESTDASIGQYEAMASIRNMLKDGLFEWALRQFTFNIAPGFPEVLADKYSSWIQELAKKHGATQQVLDDMMNIPKGSL